MAKKILIISCYAEGGVKYKREIIAGYFQERGFEVAIAYYAPYKLYPQLSVPFWKLFTKRPKMIEEQDSKKIINYKIGTYFPEFEFMRYFPNSLWKKVVQSYDHHFVISGTILPSRVRKFSNHRFSAWLATSYWDERQIQFAKYPWYRKVISLIDLWFNKFFEQKLLSKVNVLCISHHTKKTLKKINSKANLEVMPIPIPNDFIVKSERKAPKDFIIGFCGRLNDPRKNIDLLLQAFLQVLTKFPKTKLLLAGEKLSIKNEKILESLGILSSVIILGKLTKKELESFYEEINLFVIPSKQEGFGIVGVEAMAKAVPVVSTRCGGPADFVNEGVNGYFCDFSPSDMAQKICSIIISPSKYESFSHHSLKTVNHLFIEDAVKRKFFHFCERYQVI